MLKKDIQRLRDRIQHCADQARVKAGPGFSYSATLPDGRVQHYEITDVRSLDGLEHDVASWCVWVWSLKDYVRAAARVAGEPEAWWGYHVRQSYALMLTADLANREKHGEPPRRPWTVFRPKLGAAGVKMPMEAVRSLTLSTSVRIETADPELVEYHVQVLDGTDVLLGNALELLSDAMDAWDSALEELGL